MKWEKSLFASMIVSMMVFAMVGCGTATEVTPATQQPTTSATKPARPEGGSLGDKPSALAMPGIQQPTTNATRPASPQGGSPGDKPSAPGIDWASAAAKLGVTEQQLRDALGNLGEAPPDLAAAAQKLGISEDKLREAIGFVAGSLPPGGPGSAGPGQQPR